MAYKMVLVGGTTNCYIVYNQEMLKGFIVDPGADSARILAEVDKLNVDIEAILLTHAHGDHVSALNRVRDALDVEVYMHEDELENFRHQDPNFIAMMGGEVPDRDPDVLLKDKDVIELDCGKVEVLLTPGHTPGSACYKYDDLLLSGDTLFQGSIGRTDFPGGDLRAMMRSLDRLSKLDDNLRVLSGHGPETSIGIEKRINPYMRQVL
ncbi:MAG: MBL fold metallo-hydrolase [Peptoniphilus sp.]|nr:MBL fold metallo-hydrolase [Peptoniphilus sp.]MDD7363345.1 MBL fold metallo-hydrolase [Bacillota bacterium]MDY6044264.1 MBL fold metallo-hydrolase [Peptoniphilus sp.]